MNTQQSKGHQGIDISGFDIHRFAEARREQDLIRLLAEKWTLFERQGSWESNNAYDWLHDIALRSAVIIVKLC